MANARLTEADLAELFKKNPQLKAKVGKQLLKPKAELREFMPVFGDERKMLEVDIQSAYFSWVLHPVNEIIMPELKCIYAIPNGSNKSKTERWTHQKSGLRSGVPDIHIAVSRKPFFSFYVEMKRFSEFRKTNHGCSANQLEWHERLRNQGHKVVVIESASKAINLTKEYLGYDK